MSHLRGAAWAVLLLALFACSKRPPQERPTRILELERALPVWLTSDPPGCPIHGVDADGNPGPLLGQTPLRIGSVQITKEIWKHGTELPAPAAGSGPVFARDVTPAGVGQSTRGENIVFTLFAGAAPEPVRLELPLAPAALPTAFQRGRIVLVLPPSSCSRRAEPMPPAAGAAP